MSDDRLLTVKQATDMLGVHDDTVRRWGDDGTLPMVRTPGGHRRYPLSGVERILGKRQPEAPKDTTIRVAIYCRVSSHEQKQKGDLERQVGRVTAHCVERKHHIKEVLEDVGSGMSDNRPKLRRLFGMVNANEIDRVIVEHKDRLTRFNFGFVEAYFASHGVVIEWVSETLGKSYDDELVEDILSLMASFSARIYGKRSAENRKKARAAK
ncbi:MAG: IS607 family transposase [Actinobacteria bacterium]|nr:IS607 family transposase [Actinomycetota bacterium]NBR67328.1 IS607 family transposase [Actinomycetota bacterium]